MLCLPFAALVFPKPSVQGQEWKPLELVRATGVERQFDGPVRPIAVSRYSGMSSFTTAGGIQGSLLGADRTEVSGAAGIFTWLTAQPGWALWLPAASTAHYTSVLQPVRFSPRALKENQPAVEKSLGKAILERREGRWKDRDCLVVVVGDRMAAGARQELWIDRETGIVLKRTDRSGSQEDYQLRLDRLETAPSGIVSEFGPPAAARKLKGLVDPEILLHTAASKPSEVAADLARQGKVIGASAWLRVPPDVPGFRYAQTVVRKRAASRRETNPSVSALGAPELQPGGLPPGWSVAGQVDPNTGAIDMRFSTPDGPGARAIISGPRPGAPESSFKISMRRDESSESLSVSFISYVAPDGTLVIAPGNSAREAEEARQRARQAIGSQGVLVQSDFLDQETGDTVSFMQSRKVVLAARLRGFAVKSSERVRVEGLGDVLQQEIVAPYTIRLVSWRSGDADYLLASTSHTFQELEDMAQSTGSLRGVERPAVEPQAIH